MTADLRLAIPAVCGWLAAVIVIGVPDAATPALLVFWLVAAGLVLVRTRLALVAVAVALCCTSIALQQPARQPAVLVAAAETGQTISVIATTTSTVVPGQSSFEVLLRSVDGVRVSVPVLVFGGAPEQVLGLGSDIELTARASITEPGDDRAFLLFPRDPPGLLSGAPWYLDWANTVRGTFSTATDSLPGDGGDLLAGLAIGDTSAVSDSLDSAMKTSSLSHLTAVSGANCAIVIGLIMLAGGAVGLPRAFRIGASIAVLAAFVVLVTPEPSVLRAAAMATVVLAALASGRPVRGLPVLALVTLVLLVADPWLARNYGFVLSVLATAGLLLLAGRISAVLEWWLPRWLSLVIAVPIAAQLACQPVIILLDASIPTYGVVANLLAAPAAPVATVLGLAACVLLATAPPIGMLLCQLAWLPAAWIAAVAQFFGGAPAARLPWQPGMVGVAMLVAVSALLVFAFLGRGRLVTPARFMLAAMLVMYVVTAGWGGIVERLARPPNWQIAGCDVGQGDAFVVRSAGSVALIDTGPEPDRLEECLAALGIDRLDILILTHYDLDHVGGVEAVRDRADLVLIGPTGRAEDERIVTDLLATGVPVAAVRQGEKGLLGDLRWSILWPPVRATGDESGNPMSVTVLFEPVGECADGCLSSMFLGDLDREAQLRVLGGNRFGQVDVVKVAHHGSADQSDRMYDRLRAAVAVIGVGIENGYGHPTAELLDMLGGAGTAAARTDHDGMILLSPGPEPGTVSVWTER